MDFNTKEKRFLIASRSTGYLIKLRFFNIFCEFNILMVKSVILNIDDEIQGSVFV